MAQLTQTQLAWRGRIESGLRLAAPFLDLVLLAGDRLARTVDRAEDVEPLPARLGPDHDPRTLGDGRD